MKSISGSNAEEIALFGHICRMNINDTVDLQSVSLRA